MNGPDLSQMPCPTRVLDGINAPLSLEASSPAPGVVRLAITATAPVVLGVRDTPPDGLVLPDGVIPIRSELDVRFVPVERVVVDVPVAFVEQYLAAAISAAAGAANTEPLDA